MKQLQSTMTRRGLVTIPRAIRSALGLQTGDQLRFELLADGRTLALHRCAPQNTSLKPPAGR